MGIDASIAGGYRPIQLENPLNAMLQMGQIQNAQQANQLNAMKMAEAQREQSTSNALNAAYSSAYDPATGKLDYTRLRASLATGGQGGLLPGIDKAQQAFATGEADLATKRGTARDSFQKHMQSAFRDIGRNPSDAQITAHLEDVRGDTTYTPEQKAYVERQASMFLSMPYDQRVAAIASQGATAGDLKPTYGTQDLGGVSRVTERPAFGGAPRVVSDSLITVSPNTQAQINAQATQGSLNRASATANRAVPAAPAITPVTIEDPNRPGKFIVVDGRTGAVIGTAKPSLFAEKTAGQLKQHNIDLERAIVELERAAKPGGLIEKSTGSGAGRLIDTAVGFFGSATPGAIAIGQLQPIADIILKMVPRFEGPQSDKDTQSYKEAAGQLADANMPNKVRLAAANELVRLMKSRRTQFTNTTMESNSVPVPAQPAGPPGEVDFGSLQ